MNNPIYKDVTVNAVFPNMMESMQIAVVKKAVELKLNLINPTTTPSDVIVEIKTARLTISLTSDANGVILISQDAGFMFGDSLSILVINNPLFEDAFVQYQFPYTNSTLNMNLVRRPV